LILSKEQKFAHGIFGLLALAFLVAALSGETLGEGGDSTTHYLYARLSWSNEAYFFNHWAKPFFTLVSSPFAQMGMKGMMFFNVCCTLLAAWVAGLTAKQFDIKHWYYTPILVAAMPLILPVTLSGLTEPLSALMLILSIYYYVKDKWILALVIASFLPFVRSEGLVILAVFTVLLVFQKKYKLLPWILFGHVVFSLAGWPYYGDVLWVFTKIPYATMNSVYGQGNWMHFVNQLYFCIGPLSFVGFCLGVIFELKKWWQQGKQISLNELFLVYGIAFVFIAAHSAFWALGIFNSMGLNRVLVSIFPLCGIIAMQGMEGVMALLNPKQYTLWRGIFMVGVLGFPFLNNPASTDFEKSTSLKKDHRFMRDVLAPYLKNNYPNNRYYAAEPEFALFTNRDIFEKDVWIYPGKELPLKEMIAGDVLIYDSLVMSEERHFDLNQIRLGSDLIEDTLFSYENSRGQWINCYIFLKP
jgi:hypothetical protein